MPISREEVIWAYRLMLSREPGSESEISLQMAGNADVGGLVKSFVNTGEFRSKYRVPADYHVAPFLIPEPVGGAINIREPTLREPTSQICTYGQTEEKHYKEFGALAGYGNGNPSPHRKLWEWAYILRVLDDAGMLRAGKRGLVFAVGAEPLPSIFAARGCQILASDAPPEVGAVWGDQFANRVETLWDKRTCDRAAFFDRVSFRPIDMLDLPNDLGGFDFLWSSCSIEHLGGIAAGSEFVRKAMTSLKPGGIAVHTTEFNLSSNEETVDDSPTCIFRRRDLEQLTRDLESDGHHVRPWNFWPGKSLVDEHIDYPPFGDPHMKVALYQYVATSCGMVITKDAQSQPWQDFRRLHAWITSAITGRKNSPVRA